MNANAFLGRDHVKDNYDRDLMKFTFDKWMHDSSPRGTIFVHPDMVEYWRNARSNGGWYPNNELQFATIGPNWTVATY